MLISNRLAVRSVNFNLQNLHPNKSTGIPLQVNTNSGFHKSPPVVCELYGQNQKKPRRTEQGPHNNTNGIKLTTHPNQGKYRNN